MRTLYIVPVLVAGILAASAARAETVEGYFKKAYRFYETGAYGSALDTYREVEKRGYSGGNLFYNIGTCYLQKGMTGEVLLYYERALLFEPRNSALRSNYRYAQSLMKQPDVVPRESDIARFIAARLNYVTVGEAMVILALFYYGGVVFLLLFLFARRMKLVSFVVSACLLVSTALLIRPVMTKTTQSRNAAIVVTSVADVKAEPVKEAETVCPVYEGMKLYLLKSIGGWDKVKRADGRLGWVERGAVKRVDTF